MIFKNVNKLETLSEKKFFIEKINIINELIKKYCRKENINYNEIIISEKVVLEELKKIGILDNLKDFIMLKKIVKNEYNDLLISLTFYSNNKKNTNNI